MGPWKVTPRRVCFGWKGVRPGVRLESQTVRAGEEPEEHKRECFDGLARITPKELASTHSVKSGTLQNACCTRRRVVADLAKSARMHIVRLIEQPSKRSKREW